METGALTGYMDVAQMVLYAFWIFFAWLIFYLRREDRREGYPLESEPGVQEPSGVVWIPDPKVFRMPDGREYHVPRGDTDAGRPLAAKPVGAWPGAPLVPTGDPMRDGVGPAGYALRVDIPDVTYHGDLKIAPMRNATQFSVVEEDPDPRGMKVFAADGKVGATCVDIWVDCAESMIRYLEVEVTEELRVLVPVPLARITRDGIYVRTITAEQFAHVPVLANPDQVTRLEEDKITAYYAGGQLYALPERQEPWI